jgi:protease-4
MTSPSPFRLRGWILFMGYMALLLWAFWRSGRPGEFVHEKVDSRAPHAGHFHGDGAIAVLDIQGPIALSMGGFGGDGTAGGTLRRLRELRDEKEVKAVILRINSPGGTVASVQEIYESIRILQKSGKKVIASFQDVAASGGYYIAASADRIVANPGSIVGSIGVIFHLNNLEELAKKVGVKSVVIASGKMKDMGSPTRSLSAEERQVFEGLVQSAYGQFLSAVSEGRKMPLETLRPLADGRVFTGEQALAVGLVDVLGGFDQAIEEAKRVAGLRADKPRLILSDRPWDKIFQLLNMGAAGPWGRLARWAAPRASLEYVWE